MCLLGGYLAWVLSMSVPRNWRSDLELGQCTEKSPPCRASLALQRAETDSFLLSLIRWAGRAEGALGLYLVVLTCTLNAHPCVDIQMHFLWARATPRLEQHQPGLRACYKCRFSAPSVTYWNGICILTSSPGSPCVQQTLESSASDYLILVSQALGLGSQLACAIKEDFQAPPLVILI